METIIVELTISATGDILDFMLPAHVKLDAMMEEMIRKLENYLPGIMIDRDHPLLYNQETKRLIPANQTLAQSGLQDGSRLVLV